MKETLPDDLRGMHGGTPGGPVLLLTAFPAFDQRLGSEDALQVPKPESASNTEDPGHVVH